MSICSVNWCDRESRATGLCRRHYMQMWRLGRIKDRTTRDPNEMVDRGDHFEILLYDVESTEIGRALISREDAERVKSIKWCLQGDGYVTGDFEGRNVGLHKFVLNLFGEELVDHIKLGHELRRDCRRENLRMATRSQNVQHAELREDNTTGRRGVYKHRDTGRFTARIKFEGRKLYLGLHDSLDEAAAAYDQKCRELYGEFAVTNEDLGL